MMKISLFSDFQVAQDAHGLSWDRARHWGHGQHWCKSS
jgi:hypothetical protein